MSQSKDELRFTYKRAEDLEPYQNGYLLWPINVKDDLENCEGAFKRYDTLPNIEDVRKFALVGLKRLVPDIDDILTDDYLKLFLSSAMAQLEMEMNMFISPCEQTVSYDYIEGLFGPRFTGTAVKQFPVTAILSVKLKSVHTQTDNPVNLLDIPPNWISFRNRRLNIMADLGNIRTQSGTAGGALVPFIGAYAHGPWRPNALEVQMKVGFPEDKFPVILKDLILVQTSIGLLNDIIPILFPFNSTSVAIDGVSQSSGLPGPQFLMTRIGMLEKLRDQKKAAIKAALGQSLVMTYINT